MARSPRVFGLCSCAVSFQVVVLLLTLAGRAAAADRSKDAKQEAKAHFSAAQSHYNLNEFAEALREFKESYRLYPDPVFLFNLGQCERQLGHAEEAIKFYRSYLREQPKAANREDVLDKIAELEASLKPKQTEPKQPDEVGKPSEPPAQPQPATASEPPPVPAPAAESVPAPATVPTPATVPAAAPAESQFVAASPSRVDLTATPDAQTQAGPTPIYKRWWFWTAAAAVAVGVGVGIYAATAGDDLTIPSSGLGSKKVF